MDYNFSNQSPQHLAWHETLEVHELVAFQSVGLIKLKKAYNNVTDPALKDLYRHSINSLSGNIRELLAFYSLAPNAREKEERDDNLPFYAGDLLALAKTSVRNYAIAVTETATPELRNVLTNQLVGAINTHGEVYQYMYERSYYPSYDLKKLLQNDMNLANRALSQSL